MTYRAYFEVSLFSNINGTFIENEITATFEADSFSTAICECFINFLNAYIFKEDGNTPTMRKIELWKIEEDETGKELIFKDKDDDE
jgi:hypothetical protein